MLQVVILAAGQGKRMQSRLPKVLHPIAGKPLLQHVIETANQLTSTLPLCIVYGHQGPLLRQTFNNNNLEWVEQTSQQGTGHAVQQALPMLVKADHVLVLYGDVPLINVDTLKQLIQTTPDDAIGMITANVTTPYGYGRIKRDSKQNVIAIIEEKDATDVERAITEVNSGIYYVPLKYLQKWLPTLKPHNAQGEHYLTDIIALAVAEKIKIHTIQPKMQEEIYGVNDKIQLAVLERFYQLQQANKLMRAGVTLLDPTRLDIRGHVQAGQDVVIDANVILEGNIVLGNGCKIGANSILRDTTLGDLVEIKTHCVIEGATIADQAIIGPFARVRPDTKIAAHAHIGNFVEIKNTEIGVGSKINHLSYIGDSQIGKNVNIGAGTITCNYDGAYKHKTIVGDNVHIGSDTQLVAPVMVGEGATIGAGSTIIKDVPAHQLTLTTRIEQRIVQAWKRPEKTK